MNVNQYIYIHITHEKYINTKIYIYTQLYSWNDARNDEQNEDEHVYANDEHETGNDEKEQEDEEEKDDEWLL